MSKVTYLLGAGASYGKVDASQNHVSGVPIVRELPTAIDTLINAIENGSESFCQNSSAQKQLSFDQCNELLTSFKRFKTYVNKGDTIDRNEVLKKLVSSKC